MRDRDRRAVAPVALWMALLLGALLLSPTRLDAEEQRLGPEIPAPPGEQATVPEILAWLAPEGLTETWWCEVRYGDGPAGWVVSGRLPAPEGHQLTHEAAFITIQRDASASEVFRIVGSTRVLRDAEGRRIHSVTQSWQGPSRTREEIRIEGEQLHWTHTTLGGTESGTQPLPAGYADSEQVFLQQMPEPDLGTTLEFQTFHVDTRRFQTESIEIREPLEHPFGEGTLPAWRVHSRSPTTASDMIIHTSGRALAGELSGGALSFHRIPEPPADPEASLPLGRILSMIEVEGRIPEWRSAERALVTVSFAPREGEDEREPLFHDSAYYKVIERMQGSTRLELQAQGIPDAASTLTRPMADLPAAVAPLLGASTQAQSEHPEIVETMEGIVGTTESALDATQLIVSWVSNFFEGGSGETASASALQALRQGCGDCTEHAALAIALLRAAGIPARRAGGIVYMEWSGDRVVAGHHAWAEVWLGEWVPIDPVLGDVGLSACYILREVERWPGDAGPPGSGRFMNEIRKLRFGS